MTNKKRFYTIGHRTSNYLSFRDRDQVIRSNSTIVSPDRLLNANYPTVMDADSLEVYPVTTPTVYSPTAFNNNLDNWDGQVSVLYNPSPSSLTKEPTKLGRFSSAKNYLLV